MKEGDSFEHTFTVSEAVHTGFVEIFQDRNPLHTDARFAQAKGFRGEVMHGNILNGFLSYFIGECLPTKDVIIHAQSIKFSLPVYMNDELAFSARIVGFFESVNTYEFKFSFRNKEGKAVAKGDIQIGILK
jgi:3-hydroxybutyryl-CoA dehydratase